MLADESERRAGLPLGAGRRRWTRRSRTEVLWRTLTSLVAAGVVVAYALPGGAYDIVVRQEYGLVVWGAVAVGLAVGLLPRARPSRAVLIVLGALLAYTAWV